MIRVTVYNEYLHEKTNEAVRAVYPNGIHSALREALESETVSVRTVTLDSIEELTETLLAETDVLVWWGHRAHHQVPDEIAERVQRAVLCGMGAIFLHSAHHSKPFKRLMGTTCDLTWRENGDRELVWVCDPAHPIAEGIGRFIKLEAEETYGEPFTIPEPDRTVFLGNFEGGEAFRAGCCFHRGNGRIFYFQPGHETYPTFRNPGVIRVLQNAVRWANPIYRVSSLGSPHVEKPLV
ncbi:MAG: trehalose utilization protein ThuA [Ruminococcaceae bacterium]|nr:trehalose utilization protein ThuA [Oscillospiraceae bacterium]